MLRDGLAQLRRKLHRACRNQARRLLRTQASDSNLGYSTAYSAKHTLGDLEADVEENDISGSLRDEIITYTVQGIKRTTEASMGPALYCVVISA